MTRTAAWFTLSLSGLLIGVGGMLHPHADTSKDYQHAVSGMLHNETWPMTHGLSLAGLILLVISLTVLIRTVGETWPSKVRRWATALAVAAILGVLEMTPHLFAYTEAADLDAGRSTPLLLVHTWIQFVSAPALGICAAGLAVVSSRDRSFGNGPVLAALAVVGGVAFGAAGILMALTHQPGVSILFVGAAGIALWLLCSGIRVARKG